MQVANVEYAGHVAAEARRDPFAPEPQHFLAAAYRDKVEVRLKCPGCGDTIDVGRVDRLPWAPQHKPEGTYYEVTNSIEMSSGGFRVGGMRNAVSAASASRTRGQVAAPSHHYSRDHQETRLVERDNLPADVLEETGSHRYRFECHCGARPDVTDAKLASLFVGAYVAGLRSVTLP